MSYAAFPLYAVRPSWLALGGAGRELAIRGARELEAELAGVAGVTAFVARGLSGTTDLFLCVQSQQIEGVEAYLRQLPLLGAGRHLQTQQLWLGCGGADQAPGEFAGLYAVSESDPAVAVAATLESGIALSVWRCEGLAPAEHLVLASAATPTDLHDFHRRWRREERTLRAHPLAVGRRRDLGEALASFAPATST